MLTDGAVGNTKAIIDLISLEAYKQNSRVHTFGVGQGASTELIKLGAAAGFGSYSFIYNNSEIEEKVISALGRNYSPVRRLHHLRAFD